MTRLIGPVRTAPSDTRRSRTAGRVGWSFVLLSALAVVAFSAAPYFTASLRELAGDGVGLAPTYAETSVFVQAAFYAHIVGGATARVNRGDD